MKRKKKTAAILAAVMLLSAILSGCIRKTDSEAPLTDAPETSNAIRIQESPAAAGYTLTGRQTQHLTDPALPEALSQLSISPDGETDSRIIDCSQTFLIETAGKIDEETLRQYVRIQPEAELCFTRCSDTSYTVTPASPLNADTVYRFTVGDADRPAGSFAFQTRRETVVKSVLPADQAENVPTNTGIEAVFSDRVECDDFAAHFSITPSVEGSVSRYPDGKTLVFVPDKPLEANTEYTVTIRAGVRGEGGLETASDRVFRFRTADRADYGDPVCSLQLYDSQPVFSTTQNPALRYGIWAYGTQSSVSARALSLKLWAYPDAAAALDAMKAAQASAGDIAHTREGLAYPTDSLRLLYEGDADTQIESGSDSYENGTLLLPSCDRGIYLAEITMSLDGEQMRAQAIVQISDLSVYTESSDGQTLLWVSRSGEPAAGCSVDADLFSRTEGWNANAGFRPFSAQTDADGICLIPNAADNALFATISDGADFQIVPIQAVKEQPDETRYSTYLYTDRETYFADDTVQFWGMLRPQTALSELPSALTLQIGLLSTGIRVAIHADGSFSGSYRIEDWTAYGVYLRLNAPDGTTLLSKFVSVTQEEKPVYQASMTFDKPFYTYGETGTLTVSASFFDGTPASGLKFAVYGDQGINAELTTGADGSASCTFTCLEVHSNTTYPSAIRAAARLTGYETVSLRTNAQAIFFHSSGFLYNERIDGTQTNVRLNALDTTRLPEEFHLYDADFPACAYGEGMTQTLSVMLRKIEYVRHERQGAYDPISKTTSKDIWYERTEKVERSFEAQAVDGVLTLPHYAADDFRGYWYYDISWKDPHNGVVYKTGFCAVLNDDTDYTSFNFDADRGYTLETNQKRFGVGDPISAQLRLDGESYTRPVLYTLHSETGYIWALSRNGSFSGVYDAAHVSGAVLNAAVAGEGFASSLYLPYDYQTYNTLNVSVTADREKYAPGDTAQITVKADGVTGGLALLSMVDEACFALEEQNADPLREYYEDLTGGYYSSWDDRYYGSLRKGMLCNARFPLYGERWYDDITAEDCAEAAPATGSGMYMLSNAAEAESKLLSGGNSVTIREDFANNPLFETQSFGADGTAVFTITVPDNITSWRFTALAVSGLEGSALNSLCWGNAVSDAVATLPFFLNTSICSRYIAGDTVSFSARAYGSGAAQRFSCVAELYDQSGQLLGTREEEGSTGDFVWFDFGTLDIGDYEVVVKASSGDCSDGVKLPFAVSESGMELTVRRSIGTDALTTLHPASYPVLLSFYDDTYDLYIRVLRGIRSRYTRRSDALASYAAALTASDRLFGYTDEEGLSDIRDAISMRDGFLSLLPYSEGDAELSAKICAAAPMALSDSRREELCSAFERYLTQEQYADETGLCAALLGLTALGQPTLDLLYHTAAAAEDFSDEAKWYLCAALAYAGDYSGALLLYNALLEESGIREGAELHIASAESVEKDIACTALALMAASKICPSDADAMAEYLLTHTASTDLHCLELSAYLTNFLPAEVKTTHFRYTLDGHEQSVTLKAGQREAIWMDKAQFSSFALLEADEAVRIYAVYGASVQEALDGMEPDSRLTLRRTIEPSGQWDGVYRVTLHYEGVSDRNTQYFRLDDVIPAGARLFRIETANDLSEGDVYSGAYLYQNGGQRLSGGIYAYAALSNQLSGRQIYRFSGSISYTVRGAVQGAFLYESALARDEQSSTYAQTQRMRLNIAENGWQAEPVTE